jgi:8-oxo-dGTP pyrophosphatase MutT (NUDIX family)
MPGPAIRTDIVDVYVFRIRSAQPADAEFLQLHRKSSARVMGDTWQPVMGHVEAGETATQTALRELHEETGFAANDPARPLLGLWQLESLNAFFLASIDAVMLSPCFAAQVPPGIDPLLDDVHDAFRWVRRDHADRSFLWPGQRQSIEQIVRDILSSDAPAREHLRIPLP